ncbi:MAG: DUF4384 domain-containing protein [Nitrospirota bacterium]
MKLLAVVVLFCAAMTGYAFSSSVTGAKSIFFNESTSIQISVDSQKGPVDTRDKKQKPVTTTNDKKFMGISYQIVMLSPDKMPEVVKESRTFRNGDRIKLLLKSNKSGYLSIYNIGTSGNSHMLFGGQVNAFADYEIPAKGNLLLTGPPGVETLLVMLSNSPLGIHSEGTNNSIQNIVHKCNQAIVTGSKDIVLADSMDTSYAVLSASEGCPSAATGSKDIVLESDAGSHYVVVPENQLVSNNGAITLQIKLKHK